MKKQLYLILAVILSSHFAFAQSASMTAPQAKNNRIVKSNTTPSQSKDFDNPIFESDFSNPDVWVIENEAGNDDDWVIGTDVPSGDFPIAGINSTTAENGFALFDSDLYCSGSQNASLSTVELDLSSAESVSIQFETYYRAYLGECFLETSTDGVVWQSQTILGEIPLNEATANPVILTFSLPELDGEDAGYVRFRYVGGCDYAWMIDDVKIAATPEFELRLNQAWYDEHILLENAPNSPDVEYIDNLEYSGYRVGQVRPLTFVAEVQNLGFGELTGITVQFTVNTPQGPEVFPSDAITLDPFEVDTVIIADVELAAFAGGGIIGDYTVSFLAAANEDESDFTNNTVADKTFNVNEERMSNDQGDTYQTTGQTGFDIIWGNPSTYVEETTVNYIQFGLDDEITIDGEGTLTTVPGELIWVNIREGAVFEETDETVRLFDESEIEYTIEEEAISSGGALNWITVMLEDPVTLSANTLYYSEVQVPPTGSPVALMAQTAQSEFLSGVSFNFNNTNDNFPAGFFVTGANSPAIRMGFTGPTSTSDRNDLGFFMSQNYPNPIADGSTRISWELVKPHENIVFSITDNTGKMVYRKDLGDRPAGVQEDIILSNLNLADGIYQYGLKVGNQRLVRKMVITK